MKSAVVCECPNCGASLSEHDKKCPYCDTIIINTRFNKFNNGIIEFEYEGEKIKCYISEINKRVISGYEARDIQGNICREPNVVKRIFVLKEI